MTNQDNFILDEIDPDLGERIDCRQAQPVRALRRCRRSRSAAPR